MRILRDLTLGEYRPGVSPIHRLDPRAKLGSCVLLIVAVFSTGRAWGVACTWPMLVLGVGMARLPVGYFIRGIRPFLWLFGFTVFLHGIVTPGTGLVGLPWLCAELTREGLSRGAWISAQLATAICLSSLLTLTTDPTDLVWALQRLASPLNRLRVPVNEFCVATLVALRFLPILREELDRMGGTRPVRGEDPVQGPLKERIRESAALLTQLLRRLFERAEALVPTTEEAGQEWGISKTDASARGLGRGEWITFGGTLFTTVAAVGLRFWG